MFSTVSQKYILAAFVLHLLDVLYGTINVK